MDTLWSSSNSRDSSHLLPISKKLRLLAKFQSVDIDDAFPECPHYPTSFTGYTSSGISDSTSCLPLNFKAKLEVVGTAALFQISDVCFWSDISGVKPLKHPRKSRKTNFWTYESRVASSVLARGAALTKGYRNFAHFSLGPCRLTAKVHSPGATLEYFFRHLPIWDIAILLVGDWFEGV